jgi:hypothetical protein
VVNENTARNKPQSNPTPSFFCLWPLIHLSLSTATTTTGVTDFLWPPLVSGQWGLEAEAGSGWSLRPPTRNCTPLESQQQRRYLDAMQPRAKRLPRESASSVQLGFCFCMEKSLFPIPCHIPGELSAMAGAHPADRPGYFLR